MNKWFLASLFCVFALIVLYISPKTPPKGDEIHYLLTAHSLIYDHDLDIGNNYTQRDYSLWTEVEIDSHAVVGQDNGEYMYHGLGLFPIILALPYAIAGRLGVHLFLVGIFILLIHQLYKFSLIIGVKPKMAMLILAIFSLSVPLLNYSFVIFPEVFGALLIIFSLNHKTSSFVGLLPWIHLRFIPITVFLLLNRTKKALVASILLIISYFGFHWLIYGTPNPMQVYAAVGINTATGNILQNIVLSLTDTQYGLLFYSPIYIFGVVGLKYIPKQTRYLIITIFAIYALPVFRYYDWNGGYSPPARYLAGLVPLLIPTTAIYLQKYKGLLIRILFALLTIWSLFAGFVNLFLTKDFGFVYINGFSEVLNRAWSIVHFNIYRVAPVYYPYHTFTLWHVIWLIAAIVLCVVLIVARNKR